MQERQRANNWVRHLCCSRTSISVYVAAIAVLMIGAAADAAATSDGISVRTGGVKVSLKLSAPGGTKVIFQRADNVGRNS